jgi:hypothetical protein
MAKGDKPQIAQISRIEGDLVWLVSEGCRRVGEGKSSHGGHGGNGGHGVGKGMVRSGERRTVNGER